MSKKMLKRSLALGALMAFVITGQAWADVVKVETNDGKRTAAVAYDTTGNNLTMGKSEVKNFVNESEFNRTFGLALTYNVNGDDSNEYGSKDLTVTGAEGSVLNITAKNGTERVQGIRINYGGIFDVKGGTLNITVDGSNASQAIGIANYHNANINADSTIINVTGNKGYVWGITNENYQKSNNEYEGVITVKNLNATVTAVTGGTGIVGYEGTVAKDVVAGLNTNYGKNNLTGDSTKIIVNNNADGFAYAGGIVTQSDPNRPQAVVNINANNTEIEVYNTGTSLHKGVIGVRASGHGGVNFNGATATVTVDGGSEKVVGLKAQHGATIKSETENSLTVDVESNTEKAVYGIVADDELGGASNIDLKGTTVVEATNNGTGRAYGVYGEAGADIDLAGTNITATSEEGRADGIYAETNANIAVSGDLTVTATGKGLTHGVYAIDNGKISLGSDASKIDISATSDYKAIGIRAYSSDSEGNASKINVVADELDINATATGNEIAFGVYSSADDDDGTAKSEIVINANKTTITANAAEGNANAIVAFSSSSVTIEGDLEATGDNVIHTRGGAQTVINKSGKGTVNLNGDIIFARAEEGSDEIIDADVFVNLTNEKSKFTGAVLVGNGDKTEITGMKISLSNGAQWELSEASVVNQASFGENAVLMLKEGSVFEAEKDSEGNATTGGVYALNAGGGDSNELTVAQGAKLQIGNIKETTYNIATGFENYEAVKGWTEIADNNLMKAEMQATGTNLQAVVSAKDAGQIAEDMGVDSGTASALGSIIEAANKAGNVEGTPAANVVEFAEKIAEAPAGVAAAAAEAVIKMAEAGGNSATAANIVKNVTGVTNDRLSFNCGHSAPHKGGHGVGLFEEGSGADIWAEYVHGKDKVEDMPSSAGASSYEGQYNGFVLGVDFKKVNKFQSGIAFNYGEGDTNTVGSAVRTRSDYDFWGVGYYGSIHNDDSNVIFDINYAQTDSEVTQKNLTGDIEASPETTTWSAGVKLEKLYQNENVQIVPYTGLRYMSIDPDDYATKCGTYKYSMDRQDIWLLPVGVSIRQEIANDNGWTVSPRVDLSYIWAFGDTDSNMEFATALNTKTNIGYDVMDDGSFLGLVGIEAHKGQWGYGVAYSYQKGDHSESKKWYVDVNYSF